MSVHHPTEWRCPPDSSTTLAEHLRPKAALLARLLGAGGPSFRQRREWRALDDMKEVELRDIGITRADVDRVFSSDFAREFAMPGAALREWR